MANEQNLRPVRTKKEARERGRAGGIKSGEVRREEKIFKKAIAERMGYEDFNEMVDNLIKRAKANDKSFEVLRDTIGQKPKDELEVTNEKPFEVNIKVIK